MSPEPIRSSELGSGTRVVTRKKSAFPPLPSGGNGTPPGGNGSPPGGNGPLGSPLIEPPLDIPPLPPIVISTDLPPDLPPPGGNGPPAGGSNPGGSNGGGGSGNPGNTVSGSGNPNPDQRQDVPEPSTMMMLASALFALSILRRRRMAGKPMLATQAIGRRVQPKG